MTDLRDLIARALYEHHGAGIGGGNFHSWNEIVEGGENRPYPEYPHLVDEFRARADAVLAVLDDHDAKVRAETVGYVAQIASDTLRMCQAGGVGERNILPPEQEAGFQLCIDNIANLAKSMKGEQA